MIGVNTHHFFAFMIDLPSHNRLVFAAELYSWLEVIFICMTKTEQPFN